MKHGNLTIIGTSHVARESVKRVEETILNERPDIIALELDANRAVGLMAEKKENKLAFLRVGLQGFLFAVIGSWVQKRIGRAIGSLPGAEMKRALLLAQEHKIPVALIDQDIETTLRRFSRCLTWKEKFRLLYDFIAGIFFPDRELKELGLLDLNKVPEKKLIKIVMDKLKSRYPGIYRVLVEERNQFMAGQLHNIIINNPEKKIVAVIGAGHEEDIVSRLEALENHAF